MPKLCIPPAHPHNRAVRAKLLSFSAISTQPWVSQGLIHFSCASLALGWQPRWVRRGKSISLWQGTSFLTRGKMPVVYISLALLCWQIWVVALLLNWYGWVLSQPSPALKGVPGMRHGEIILLLPAGKLFSSHTVGRNTCFVQSAPLDWRSTAESPPKKTETSYNRIPSRFFISTLFQRVQANSKVTEGMFSSKDQGLKGPSSLKQMIPHFSLLLWLQ